MFLEEADVVVVGLFGSILYCVWEARNVCLFRCDPSTLGYVLTRVQMLLPSAMMQATVVASTASLPCVWSRPDGDIVKVNFDTSLSSSRIACLGYVARYGDDLVLASTTSSLWRLWDELLFCPQS